VSSHRSSCSYQAEEYEMPVSGTQLLLVQREMSIPTSDSSGGTFSLGRLFLDQHGVPVVLAGHFTELGEVTRDQDTG
jgi:hypothetical protein